MSETAAPAFTDTSAQNTELASLEAQEWIEAVTGRTFSASFRESLEDGVILCELMNKIAPGSIRRINRLKSTIAHLDNVQQFLTACQDLGLNDAQLFDKFDLQDARGVRGEGVKRNESDRRIRSVCVTLYWLGRVVAELEDYCGPHLDLDAFRSIMDGTYNFQGSTPSEQSTLEAEPRERATATENGYSLTFEQEQTADELLADIQNAVDELLLDFQMSPASDKTDGGVTPTASAKLGVSLHMNSRNGGFGFQVVGGADTGIPAQVELVLPGSAAEEAGVMTGDEVVSVNKKDISGLSHQQLVGMIKKSGSEGSVVLGLIRTIGQPKTATPPTTATTQQQQHYQLNTADPHSSSSSSSNSLPAITRKPKKAKPSSPPNSPPPPPPAEEVRPQQLPANNTPSPIDWEKEERELERQAQVMSPKRNQVPEVTEIDIRQPLATVIEEDSFTDDLAELFESIPPPLSPSPSPPSPVHPLTPPPTARETDEQRLAMERELQELVEMTTASELKQLELEIQAENMMKQEKERALREAEEKAKIKPPPEVASPTSPKAPPLVKEKPTSKRQRSSMDIEFEELLQFASVDSSTVPPVEEEETAPLFETPPLPMPTSQPPKRQTKSVEPPPPTKPKPKKKPVPLSPVEDVKSPERITMNGLADDIQKELNLPTTTTAPIELSSETSSTPPKPSFLMLCSKDLQDIRPVTPEEAAEVLGDIKIHRVQRTRWTPKGSKTEVLSPLQISEQQSRHFKRHQEPFNPVQTSRPVSEPMLQSMAPLLQQSSLPQFDHLMSKSSPPRDRSVTLPRGYGGSRNQNSNQAYTQVYSNQAGNPKSPPRSADYHSYLQRRTIDPAEMTRPQQQTQEDWDKWRLKQQQEETRKKQQEWKSHEELRSNHQVFKQALSQNQRNEHQWKSQEEIRHKKHAPLMKQSTQPSEASSFHNGSSDWRTVRSQTWSNRSRVKDGPHAAYAVRASGQHELCSRCHKSLSGSILCVPALKMQFHLQCFTCRVCRSALSRGAQNTTVMVKNMQIHCRFCLSSDQGVFTTEC